MQRFGLGVLVFLCASLIPSTARADEIVTWSGTGTGVDGVTLSATAIFRIYTDADGRQYLEVTLQNTGDSSGTDADKSANTLTGLFFDLPDGITLSPTSATADYLVNASSCDAVEGGCASINQNVGGEFAYATGTWSGHEGSHGISSSGYIGASAGNFNGPNLDDPDAPDGINFGIVAPTSQYEFKPTGGKNGLTAQPLIDGEVVFTLAISGGTLLESGITNVSFQYGTDIKEPKFVAGINVTPVPEPAVLFLFGSATVVALVRRRGRSRSRS